MSRRSFRKLGSVDALGVVQDLDPLFKPRSIPYSKEDIRRASNLPGFTALPRQLIPNERPVMQPPLYYYGWKIDWDKLLKYAEDNDLCAYALQEVDDDFEDEENEPEAEVLTCDESYTVLKVLRNLANDVGIRLPTDCELRSVLADGTIVPFFALYSNYELAEAPRKARLLRLQDHLRLRIGETAPPKWFPDYDFRWRQRYWQ
ncbi:hypothetical protein PHLCEN_2v11357 [Hermanssonia centrifuga]|uniref:Uncharacterized protein n=1 Tax=Hermanssonia centrifuga TaxID=98765 RepID=A0A2R6NK81_9APHY|nr:hypothetical protein PHLCEN_2v11357 [Hermanssonia centrifuga]